jgi:hypothetical protein
MSLIGIANVDQREHEIAQRNQEKQNECDDPSIEVRAFTDFHRGLLVMPATMRIVDRRSGQVLKKPLKIYKTGDVREAPA